MHRISTNQIDLFLNFKTIITTRDFRFKFVDAQELLEPVYPPPITCDTTRLGVMSTTRSTLPATLPAWGLFLNDVHVKDGFVNGFLSEVDIDKVLDLHGPACLTDYVKR